MIKRDPRALLAQKRTRVPLPQQKVLEESELEFQPNFEQVVEKVERRPPRQPKLLALVPHQEVEKQVAPFATGVLLTMKQMCRMFSVTNMTLYHWVQRLGLPRIHMPGGRNPPVRFDEGVVKKWAELRGKAIVHQDYRDWN